MMLFEILNQDAIETYRIWLFSHCEKFLNAPGGRNVRRSWRRI
jgi:hypothetical protein